MTTLTDSSSLPIEVMARPTLNISAQKILEDFFKLNSYPIGCTVRIKGSEGVHIVSEVSLEECDVVFFLYATDRTSWHNHDDVELVSLPSKESYEKLLRA